jgi:hypothetical protein
MRKMILLLCLQMLTCMNGRRIQNGAINSTQTDEVAVLNGKAPSRNYGKRYHF